MKPQSQYRIYTTSQSNYQNVYHLLTDLPSDFFFINNLSDQVLFGIEITNSKSRAEFELKLKSAFPKNDVTEISVRPRSWRGFVRQIKLYCYENSADYITAQSRFDRTQASDEQRLALAGKTLPPSQLGITRESVELPVQPLTKPTIQIYKNEITRLLKFARTVEPPQIPVLTPGELLEQRELVQLELLVEIYLALGTKSKNPTLNFFKEFCQDAPPSIMPRTFLITSRPDHFIAKKALSEPIRKRLLLLQDSNK